MARGNAIASGSVILTTNADGLKTGLDKAAKDVDGWGKRVGGKAGGAGGGGFLGGILGGVGKAGIAGMAIAATIGAAAGAVTHLADSFGQLSEHMDATSKQARALGTSTEFLTGMQHAADLSGVGVEELGAGLARFRRQVDGPLDQALLGFADRLQGVSDEGEKARMLTEAFGRSGIKFAAVFEEGAEGIKKLVAENKAMGNSFTEAQGKQVEAANDAITRAKKSFGGLWNQLIIGAAPFIEKIAGFAQKVITFFQPVADWFSRLWGTEMTLGIAVFEAIADAIREVIDWFGELAGGMFDWAGEMPSIQEVVVNVFRFMGKAAATAWDVIKVGAGAVAEALGFMVEHSLGPVVKAFGSLVGLAKELPDFIRPDWAVDMVAAVERADALVTGVGEKMQAWGKGTRENFGKSAEQFDKWLDNVLKPKEAGKEAGAAIMGGMAEAMAMEPMKLSGAILKGSKEAYSMIVANNLRGIPREDDGVKGIAKGVKKGNDLQKAGNRELGKIRGEMEKWEVM